MANNAAGSDDLFQRKATGLLRGWSVWDGFIYATFSINLITLGLLAFSYAPFVPDGSLMLAIILAGLYLIFQTVTYASLIAVMPRAGGDYVWTSRVLGGGRRTEVGLQRDVAEVGQRQHAEIVRMPQHRRNGHRHAGEQTGDVDERQLLALARRGVERKDDGRPVGKYDTEVAAVGGVAGKRHDAR